MFVARFERTMANAKQIVQDSGIDLRRKRPEPAVVTVIRFEPDYDAHVRSWRSLVTFPAGYLAPDWAREVIAHVAKQTGVSVRSILGLDRFIPVVSARAECAYHLWSRKNVKHGVSLPAIGRWLLRDHTSVLNLIVVYERSHGLPLSVGLDFERRKRRQKEWYERRKATELDQKQQKAAGEKRT